MDSHLLNYGILPPTSKGGLVTIVPSYNFPKYIIRRNLCFHGQKVGNIENSYFIFIFFESMNIFMGLYSLNYLKISPTFRRRFIAVVPGYNFSEHITDKQHCVPGQNERKFKFQFFFFVFFFEKY